MMGCDDDGDGAHAFDIYINLSNVGNSGCDYKVTYDNSLL